MTDTKKKILIAEDNPALLAVVKFNLDRAGFETVEARNGSIARELATIHNFDLIITDHQMPGMSGVELCEQLRQEHNYRMTPILMLTAKSLELDRDMILKDLGVRQIISKPFSPSEIVKTVNQIFETHTV